MYPALAVAVPLVVGLLALGMCFGLRSNLSSFYQKYDFFKQGDAANMETVLAETRAQLEKTQAELAALQAEHKKLHEQVQGCLQNVKISRYDAFEAMGGEMSYSILLTDAKKNGLVLTSIYGRDESRNYAKDLKDGKSAYPLADEEKALL